MTLTPPSREARTLADVLATIQKAQGLTNRRRADMISAVRTTARLLGREPAHIPAAPRLLANRLDEIAPAAHGIGAARWANLRSLLRASVALCGPITPGRHLAGLSPDWGELRARLTDRGLRTILSRLMHYCSAAGIRPEQVDDAVMTQFGEALEGSLVRAPNARLRDTRSAWNRAVQECPGWPGQPVTGVPRRQSRILPWSAFPASLRADVQAWLDRLAGADPLEELPFRPVQPGTVAVRDRQLRAFASALVARGRDPSTLASLADLVEISALKDGLRQLMAPNGDKSSSAIADLASTLKAVARHWVKAPQAQLDAISNVQRRVEVRRRVMTETNRERLRQFDDPHAARALLNLPARLAAAAERVRGRPMRAALLMQTAVAIELLLMAPVRVSNLAALDIDRHLVRPNSRSSRLHLVISASEVKNRQDLEFTLPEETITLVERYLAAHRAVLAAAGNRALFPGRGLASKGRGMLGKQISRAVRDHTGLQVHPHLFRHLTAKLYLDANPGGHEVVRRVLGHRSIETTTSYYTGSETASAVRHFDATLLRLRNSEARP